MYMPTRTNRIACLIAAVSLFFLLPAPALAQDLDDIIEDFCEDVEEDIADLVEGAADTADDLADASADFDQCLRRAADDDVEDRLECAERLTREVTDAKEDVGDGCTDFTEDFARDIERALRDAEDERLVDDFLQDDRVTNERSSAAVAVAALLPESRLCSQLCQQHFVNSIDFGVPRIVISHEKAQSPNTVIALEFAVGNRQKLARKLA